MIRRIWLKIFVIAMLVAIPLLLIGYFQEQESLQLVFGIFKSQNKTEIFDTQIENLKFLAKLDPANASSYKRQFEEIMNAKLEFHELEALRPNLLTSLQFQTLRNTVLILVISLILSFLISRTIVKTFKQLIDERKKNWKRLEDLKSLGRWQQVARALVHELRAPVTPIKLISSSLVEKHENLADDDFKLFLNEGSHIITSKVTQIEDMLTKFTSFAKLPEAQPQPVDLQHFLVTFLKTYEKSFAEFVQFKTDIAQLQSPQIPMDEKLIHNCLFNLIKNAKEANSGNQIIVSIKISQYKSETYIDIQNSGQLIPTDRVDSIFDWSFSTKKMGSQNFGIGLTVSKKVALDHGGDLYLLTNDATNRVTFRLQLPNGGQLEK